MPRIRRSKLRSTSNRSQNVRVVVCETKSRSWSRGLLTSKTDWTIFRTWSSKQTSAWTSSNWRWTGIKRSWSSGLLPRARRKKITWPLRNSDVLMRPRSRSSPFRLRNLPSKSLVRLMNLSRKWLKLKPLRLSSTKQQKNLNDCIKSATSSIYSGKTPLKTLAVVMSLSMKLVCSMVMLRAGLSARRMSMSSTLDAFREKRRPIRKPRVKFRQKSANWLKLESRYKWLMRRLRCQRAKLPSLPTNSQPLPLSFRISVEPSLTSTKSLKRRWSAWKQLRRSSLLQSLNLPPHNSLRTSSNLPTRTQKVNSKSLRTWWLR